jgi:hypothetical protein
MHLPLVFKPITFLVLLLLFLNSLQATITVNTETRIVLSASAPEPVKLAVENLRRDMAKVFGGDKPVLVETLDAASGNAIIIVDGTASELGMGLRDDVVGWEAHAVYVANDSANREHVMLHGSDQRGQIFAIYTFAEKVLGVPPLWFWSSWEPSVQEQIELQADFSVKFDSPQVRWRAGYPNDQRQLTSWRRLDDDKYRDIHFETFLRLKMNTFHVIWSMDSSFSRPYRLLRDVEVAQQHGMVVTNAHSLGAHPGRDRWNNFWRNIRNVDPAPERSLAGEAAFSDFWAYHVETKLHHDVEILHGLGFRGDGDVGFWQRDNFEDPGTDAGRAKIIERMLHKQVDIVKQVTGDEAPLMIYTLYTENCEYVAAGLLVPPQEPNLIYKFSSARRDHYPPESLLTFEFSENQKVGYYFNCQFTSTGSHIVQGEGPHKMERNFRTVHERSPTGLSASWVNAGNVREHVMEIAANAAMMWDIDAYDSSSFIREFSATYFGDKHADAIARLYEDFYNAYWQQKAPVLEGFDRQYIFQDLRLHRSMMILSNLLAEGANDLNPFPGGDWYRIDPALRGVETEVEALALGLGESILKLRELSLQADALLQELELRYRAFFNDNLRLQIYYLLHASETVYHQAMAVIAASRDQLDDRAAHIANAVEAILKIDPVLSEAEHGRFQGWYDPVRNARQGSVVRLDQRVAELKALL